MRVYNIIKLIKQIQQNLDNYSYFYAKFELDHQNQFIGNPQIKK